MYCLDACHNIDPLAAGANEYFVEGKTQELNLRSDCFNCVRVKNSIYIKFQGKHGQKTTVVKQIQISPEIENIRAILLFYDR